jgi:hypothetical protein
MGRCVFCGEAAGWFKDRHPACDERHVTGLGLADQFAREALEDDANLPAIRAGLDELKSSHWVDDNARRSALVRAWSDGVERFADDGIVTPDEERLLKRFGETFGLDQTALDQYGAFSRLVKSLVLRDLQEGVVDRRFDASGMTRINFQRGERVAWVFSDVTLLQQKTRTEYVGGSTGVSVRVAKGVYLRSSAYRGRPVERTETVPADKGLAAFTDRHLYFAGASTAWRMPWGKILSMTPYSDGIGVIKDGANSKQQTLVLGDGVFAFNLARALSELASA